MQRTQRTHQHRMRRATYRCANIDGAWHNTCSFSFQTATSTHEPLTLCSTAADGSEPHDCGRQSGQRTKHRCHAILRTEEGWYVGQVLLFAQLLFQQHSMSTRPVQMKVQNRLKAQQTRRRSAYRILEHDGRLQACTPLISHLA